MGRYVLLDTMNLHARRGTVTSGLAQGKWLHAWSRGISAERRGERGWELKKRSFHRLRLLPWAQHTATGGFALVGASGHRRAQGRRVAEGRAVGGESYGAGRGDATRGCRGRCRARARKPLVARLPCGATERGPPSRQGRQAWGCGCSGRRASVVEGDANRIRQRGAGADRIWCGKREERRQAERGGGSGNNSRRGRNVFMGGGRRGSVFLRKGNIDNLNGEKQTEQGRNGL